MNIKEFCKRMKRIGFVEKVTDCLDPVIDDMSLDDLIFFNNKLEYYDYEEIKSLILKYTKEEM